MPQTTKQHQFFLLAAGILFIGLKLVYRQAALPDLWLFLQPISHLVALATSSASVFIPGEGYVNNHLAIVIDKSCAGFNFFALCFVMLAFSSYRSISQGYQTLLFLPALLLLSYLFTLFVNTTRILFSVFLHQPKLNLLASPPPWLHEAEGAFVYLSFLILIYLGFQFLLSSQNQPHEELA